MQDMTTTIAELKNIVKHFIEEREWQQYHTPKNLSMSIAIEAAELMELFVWTTEQESYEILKEKRAAIEQEVADIGILLLNFCMRYNIDLAHAIEEKLKLNAQKYPIEKAKGKNKKYTEL